MSAPYNAFSLTTSSFTGASLATILQTRRLSNPTISPIHPAIRPNTREKSVNRPGRRSASCDMSPTQYRFPETAKTPDLTIATSPDCKKSPKRKPVVRPLTGSLVTHMLRKHRGEGLYKGNIKALLSLDLTWEPAKPSQTRLIPSQRLGIRGRTSVFQPRRLRIERLKPSPVRILTFLPCLPLPSSPS